ncbi:MAG: glycosyltransferase family 2 protein [Candidatus Omnitrophica bacterium]|nr:glycosyltransferase family 2 protein [Candidatus Omnitrophota bacterium]
MTRPDKKTPVSVIILAKNEVSRIKECLQSVDWADEALVVDDGSTDQTAEIARGMGARVLERRMDIEGRHRNWAHAQAKHEWILSIDADERVTGELAQEIQQLLSNNPLCDIYAIPRRNHIGSRWIRHGGWYPSAQVKLFRKSRFKWEETTVHPRALSSSEKPWGALQQDLIHYSYRDISDFIGKLDRQTTLEAQKWIRDGRRMSLGKAVFRSIDRFLRALWFKKGHRDGFIGYFAAVCAGLYQFLSYAKYWHMKQQATGPAAVRPTRGPLRPVWILPRRGASPRHPWPGPTAKSCTLSAVILSRNAAVTIGDCLDSVRWADQMIVVDGGSTDETVSLCEKAGAQVIRRPPTDNFGEERNAGTDTARGDWVLQLDADEVVTLEFREALEWILRSDGPYAAYKFRRINFFLGRRMRFGGWEHDSLHLFKRGFARYEGRVHERLAVQGRIGTLKVGVHHTPFHSLEQFLDRQNRYTTLEAAQLVETQGPIPIRRIWTETRVKPIKLFWKILVKKQGFRHGTLGLIFGTLFAFVHFLKWAKAWELLYAKADR